MSKKHAVKAVSLLWIGSLLGAGCAFLTQIILARQLGPSEYGIFASALAMMTLFAPLAGFGIAGYWLNVFGQEGWHAKRWLPGSFKFITLSTLIVVLLLTGWSMLGPHNALTATVLLVLTNYILGQLAVELVSGKLQLEERYLNLAVWQFLPHALRLLLVVMLVYATTLIPNVQNFAYAYAGIALSIFAVGFVLLLRMYQGKFSLIGHGEADGLGVLKEQISPGMFQVAAQSWPFGLAGFFYLIYYQSDIILLKYLSGAETAGIYNVAFLVMAVVYLLPSVIYQKYMLPKLYRWAEHDHERFLEIYRLGCGSMLTLGLTVMIILLPVVSWVVPLLFGKEYSEAGKLLLLLVFSVPLRFLVTSISGVFVSRVNIRRKNLYLGIVAVVNVLLNIILIPIYASFGAAIATLISELMLLLLFLLGVRNHVFGKVAWTGWNIRFNSI